MTSERQHASSSHLVASLQVRDEGDVALSRQRAKRFAALAGLSLSDQARFSTAVAEIARNSVRHAGSGAVRFALETIGRRNFVQATISDDGPGIPGLEDILLGVTAAPNAAGGITEARKLVDDFSIESTPDGTHVRLAKAVPPSAPHIESEMIPSWTLLLEQDTSENAWAERRQETQDLSQTLSELRRKEIDLNRQLRKIRRLNQKLDVLSLVASKTDNGVIITDRDGLIEWVNDGFVRITGFDAMEVYGKKPGHFLQGPETDSATVQRIREKLKSKQSFTEEILNYNKQGHPYWVAMKIFPVLDDRDNVTRFIAIQSDVTKHRQSEQDLERAKENAELASRAKSDFLANISHEIRTPMNAIIGMTELALDTSLTDEQRELLETVRGSSRGLLRLLSDLLDLSRIEARKVDLEVAPFCLRDALDEALRPLREKAIGKHLAVSVAVADNVDEVVVGDASRLRQVIVNLFENAIRFTRSGHVHISVEEDSREHDSRVLHFKVADTGIGIPPQQQEQIFEAFHQVDSSMKRRYGGAGLGLSISRSLVERMGGQLWVESEVERGSTFHFTVRFETPAGQVLANGGDGCPDEISKPDSAERFNIPEPTSHPLRILLAEDIEANQQLVVRILERRGHQVTIATDGQAAVKLCRLHDFDIVVMDIQMPEMDGFEATQTIREFEYALDKHVPIVAMTAHAMKGDRERCLAAGMDGYLAKPIDAVQLITDIEALAVRKPADKAPSAPATVATDNRHSESAMNGFDFSTAIARMDGDLEIFGELAGFFQKDSKKLLATIRKALDNEDPKALERAAHSLKGLASNFDAEGAVYAARRLETMGQRKAIEDGDAAFQIAKLETNRLVAALKTFLDVK